MPVSGKNFNQTESSISAFFQETVCRFCAKSEVHNGWECTILSRACWSAVSITMSSRPAVIQLFRESSNRAHGFSDARFSQMMID